MPFHACTASGPCGSGFCSMGSLLWMALILIGAILARRASACVYLMGTSPDSQAAPVAGTHWTYGFRGDDWEGVDATNTSWSCHGAAATAQSPINLVSGTAADASLRTSWSYSAATSNGSNIQVINNGHTIQVQWAPDTLTSTVQIQAAGGNVLDVIDADKRANAEFTAVPAKPLQFHFHTASEHTVDGTYYPMEMHIVHNVAQADLAGCPEKGCLMVTGILFKLADDDADNPALDAIWELMPMREGVMVDMPEGAKLDIEALMPPADKRAYQQYSGSLTTPPCTQGLLWHVFSTPQTMSVAQYNKYSKAVGLKECSEKAAPASIPGARRLLADSADTTTTRTPFVRGSYTGFERLSAEAAAGRRLLAEDAAVGEADNWNCTIVSYGATNRNIQPLLNRTVLVFDA